MIELTHRHKLTKDKAVAVTPSTVIAEVFDKEHKNVLRDIENLVAQNRVTKSMFIESTYQNRGKDYKQYLLTRDGYTLLAFGFTGAKALEFKLKYIEAFNIMEQEIKRQQIARVDSKQSFKRVTDALQALKGDSIKSYHYSTETSMITKIVLGMNSKQYKEANNIEGDLRDHLTASQLELLEALEDYDTMLIKAGVEDYRTRKSKCEEHYHLIVKAVA